MKKALALTLVFALLLCFASCAANPSDTSDTESVESDESSEVSDTVSETVSETASDESTEPIERTWPTISGDFIQLGTFRSLSDAQLSQHFDYLVEAGIEYLVLSCFNEIDKNGNMIYDYEDIFARALKIAEAKGVKCFISTPQTSGSLLYDAMYDYNVAIGYAAKSVEILKGLYDKYAALYPNAFYGWYFTPEVPNGFVSWSESVYTNCIAVIGSCKKGLAEIDADMPLMLSPYFTCKSGYSTASDTAAAWKRILTESGLGKGDIFCPQDCIGSGLLHFDCYLDFFREINAALKDTGIAFWGNPETFIQENWSSAPISRYVRQLNELAPYVDGYISFAYSHYYAPTLGAERKVYHDDYVYYRNNGKLKDTDLPDTASGTIEVKSGVSGLTYTINASNTSKVLLKAVIYCGGKEMQTVYFDTAPAKRFAETATLTGRYISGSGEVYAVLYDCQFNEYKTNTIAVDTEQFDTVQVISTGCSYTQVYSGNQGYPDDGKKLTDGAYASAPAYSDPALSGYADTNTVTFIIDLGSVKKISAAGVNCLSNGNAGSYAPGGFTVYLSEDGTSYVEAGVAKSANFEEVGGYTDILAEIAGISARYVKFIVTPLNGWFFVDELTVYGTK